MLSFQPKASLFLGASAWISKICFGSEHYPSPPEGPCRVTGRRGRQHVRTIQLCSNPVARERQQRLITAWSPQSQLEIALSRTEPHCLRSDVLDALAKLAAEKSEPEPRLREALRTAPWLAADERRIAPQDVLALPPSVDEAARALLLRSGQPAPFLPVRKLAIDVREHPGFVLLGKVDSTGSALVFRGVGTDDRGLGNRRAPRTSRRLPD